jgi:Uncharacterized conserved protein (DUF2285)
MSEKSAGPAAAGAVAKPPDSDQLTAFDHDHLVVYLRVLDAVADGVDWTIIAREVIGIDPLQDEAAAKHVFEAYRARAQWMARVGYRLLVSGGRKS